MKKEWNPGYTWLPQKTKKVFRAMKLTFLLSMCFTLSLSATTLAQQRVSMQLGETKLKNVFEEIQRQTNHVLVYSDDQMELGKKVTANFDDATVEDVLGQVLQGMGMTFRFENDYVIISKTKLNTLPQSVEGRTVKGTVLDVEGNPLPGVTIIIQGTTVGTSTDNSGNFSIRIPDNKSIVLLFSMVGMKTETRAITHETEVKVTLEEEASALDEAIVIGYGTTTKKDLTGSVARFDSQILEESVATNVADMMQGQIPGLSILSGSGAPGDPARLEIRGVASLSNVSPLIVVDDVPMPSDFDINELNPGDINTIDVLKGASSAAIYGSRAAGGVIMITTKGGMRMQPPTITYDYSASFESLTDPINTLTTDEFKMLVMEAARNTARINGYEDVTEYSAYRRFAAPDFWGEENTPWMKYILRNGSTQQHRVSLRGGGANVGYNASFSYADEKGEVKASAFKRYTYELGFNTDVKPWMKATFRLSGTISEQVRSGTMVSDAATARPDLKAYNDDGTLYLHEYESYGQIYYVQNPIIEMTENTTTDESNSLRMSANLEFKILPELKLFTQYSHNIRKSESYKYMSSRTYQGSDYWGGQKGEGQKGHRNSTTREFEARLTYNDAFKDDHRITVVGAMTYTNEDSDNYNFSMVDFPDDNVQNAIWQGTNMSDGWNALSGDAVGSVMLSFVGRADYRFKDRYLLTASVRADGSSRFSPDNRWGIFPSVALGWVISDEKFLKKATWLPYLKLRAGYGKTGNGWVGEYGWRTMFTNEEYNGKPAVIPEQIGNDELKWESTVQWDLGLDYGFLKGQRISGTLGFYLKKTEGLLYSYTMAPSTGMTSTRVNFANIENKGVEFDINAQIIRNKDWNWSFGFNINKNINKITNLDADMVSTPGATWLNNTVIKEGESLGQIYGFETDGVFQTQAEVDYYESLNPDYRYQEQYDYRITAPGDLKLVDQTGDGRVNVTSGVYEDMTILGCSRPDFEGGFNTRLSWKGLSFSLQATYSYGAQKVWQAYSKQFNFSGSNPGNVLDIALNRWTPENPTNEYPSVRLDFYANYFTDFVVFDASYLKISNVNLSYNLPQRIVEKTKVFSKISLSASANDLFTFTSYPGPSPESWSSNVISGASMDSDIYPSTRKFNFGISLTIK